MKLLGSITNKITKDKNVIRHMPDSEIIEVVLVYCNIVNNNFQQDSRVLHTFVPNKSFSQLLDILPKNLMFLKTFVSELLILIHKCDLLIKVLNH